MARQSTQGRRPHGAALACLVFLVGATVARASTGPGEAAPTPTPTPRPRVLHAYQGTTPSIDGVLSPGEWSDAFSWVGIEDWMPEFQPLTPPPVSAAYPDLNATIWVKRDSARLYFAFLISDDALFGLDVRPRWLPAGNAAADNLTQQGWPWFGDEVEVLLNPSNTWGALNQSVAGNGSSWQMVVNTGKSRLGGMGVGGLLEGEPRSSAYAWENYMGWILEGSMEAAVGVARAAAPTEEGGSGGGGPGGPGGGGTYTIEWAVSFDPCVALTSSAAAGTTYYNPADYPTTAVPVGVNIAVGDVDAEALSDGNPYGLRHEMWLSGEKQNRTSLYEFGTLWLEPGPMPR